MNYDELKNSAEACSTGVVLSEEPYKTYKLLARPTTILALLAERDKLLNVVDECANHLYTVQDISRIKEMSKDALKELDK